MPEAAPPNMVSTSPSDAFCCSANPRLLGCIFDSLSVHFSYRADETLALIIYEVRNTFGDALPFSYLAARRPGKIAHSGERPGGSPDRGQLSGRRRALTTGALLGAFAALPLVPLKVVATTHWEALRLWLKGVRLVPRLDAAAAKERNTCLASGKTHAYIA